VINACNGSFSTACDPLINTFNIKDPVARLNYCSGNLAECNNLSLITVKSYNFTSCIPSSAPSSTATYTATGTSSGGSSETKSGSSTKSTSATSIETTGKSSNAGNVRPNFVGLGIILYFYLFVIYYLT